MLKFYSADLLDHFISLGVWGLQPFFRDSLKGEENQNQQNHTSYMLFLLLFIYNLEMVPIYFGLFYIH